MYMFLRFQRLDGVLTDEQIDYAVTRGWLTEAQATELKSIPSETAA